MRSTEKSERTNGGANRTKTNTGEQTEQSEQSEQSEQGEQSEQSEQGEQSEQTEQSEQRRTPPFVRSLVRFCVCFVRALVTKRVC